MNKFDRPPSKPFRLAPPPPARTVEHWAFSLATESLFALGADETSRRVAYRSTTGQLRFLPLAQ